VPEINDDKLALMRRAGAALRRIGRAAKFYDEELLGMDLSMGEFKCMLLATGDPSGDAALTVGGVARALSISEPAASVLVDKLVGRGLVVREIDSADRRRTLVKPSDAAQEWADRVRLTREMQVHGLLDLLEQGDLEAMVRGFEALATAIEEQKEQA
jgi:DNA-binding MarR family transcriptional regulator